MTKHFKCPECNAVNQESAWNEATRGIYGRDITCIGDADARDAVFICPKCALEVDGGNVVSSGEQAQLNVNIKRLHPDAVVPVYAKPGDSGFDLVATADVIIAPGDTALVPTGLAVECPEGYELQVRPRSGITLKTKLRVANSPGTVDSSYRGEVAVIVDNVAIPDYEVWRLSIDDPYEVGAVLHNGLYTIDGIGDSPSGCVLTEEAVPIGTYIIRKGDRIAQGVIAPVERVTFTVVDELGATERGSGGFGHSGVN